MIGSALTVTAKDLRLAFAKARPVQAVLLGLLLVFIFSLSAEPGQHFSAQQGMAIFWLCSSFSVVLIFSLLFRFEEENDTATALLLSPLPVQGLWLGKTLAGLVLLAMCQFFFFPAAVVFLALDLRADVGLMVLLLLGVDAGLCILGGLIRPWAMVMARGTRFDHHRLPPCKIPLLLGGIRVGSGLAGTPLDGATDWFGLIFAFDAVFAGAAFFLFPHVFRGE